MQKVTSPFPASSPNRRVYQPRIVSLHLPTWPTDRFKRGKLGAGKPGGEQGGRSPMNGPLAAARHLMQGPQRQSALRQTLIDAADAEGQDGVTA